MTQAQGTSLGVWRAVALAVVAVGCFHLAYLLPPCCFVIAVTMGCLFELTRLRPGRGAFYGGMAMGLAMYAPHLNFFRAIFGVAGMVLWVIPSIWIGLFLLMGSWVRARWGRGLAAAVVPLLWVGIAYFRSEVYYLRFTWLNAGYCLAGSGLMRVLPVVGVYGVGFVLMMGAAGLAMCGWRVRVAGSILGLAVLAAGANWRVGAAAEPAGRQLTVAGVQLEFPSGLQVSEGLDRALAMYPRADLLMLSEYTFGGPVPWEVRQWCRRRGKYLLAGGKDRIEGGGYYNTAFVVGPDGEVVFKQAKSVPIQLMRDGRPAKEQRVWDSPWGKIGICICYDLSYRAVTDELVRQGAQCILAPTMDVEDWGAWEHHLHAQVGQARAAELGLPVVRVCSSGVSQVIDARGRVVASAPYPGQGRVIGATIGLARSGQAPRDRCVGWAGMAVGGIVLGMMVVGLARGRGKSVSV